MEFRTEKNRIYLQDAEGQLLAEVTFPENMEGIVQITRTYVSELLRGQGVAGKLMEQAAKEIRLSARKAKPVCSYAVSWFEKHEEYRDILDTSE